MSFALGPKAIAAGYRLAAYETIGSTNVEAMARAAQGDPGRLWVVAGAQTAGRGRRGRSWQTPPGNLAASLLLLLPKDTMQPATLGFSAGLALESAIRSCAAPGEGDRSPGIWPPHPLGLRRAGLSSEGRGTAARLQLKWPNDLLLDGAKVAGVLLEGVTVPGGTQSIVIGVGVNVRHAPENVPYPATSLAACDVDIGAEDLFTGFAEAWVDQARIWDGGRGFPTIRSRWLERAAGLGAPIAVRLGQDVWHGTFETIDEMGQLIIRRPDGTARKIAAGEVHFGAAATAAAH